MKTKKILAFAGVVSAALILAGTGLYYHDRIMEMIKGYMPQKMSMVSMGGSSAGKMEAMPGMEMKSSGDQKGAAQVAVMITPVRRQLIGVKSGTVEERFIETTIRTVGRVDYDERKVRQINLRISGWITRLFVDYTGKSVRKGDPLFKLYSPDLVSTQEEYLLAKRTLERVKASTMVHIRRGAENQVESARNRLLLWGITEEQIGRMEEIEKPRMETTIYSPIDGIVTKKMALQGMYVTPEMNLYEIADLSAVWIYADIYEYEVPFVKTGDEVTVILASYPGEIFKGKAVYIYPYLNTETRTISVRMEFSNPDGKFKPGMYGNVEIRIKGGKKLAVPQDAVLDSGIRKLVFIDQGEGLYEPREVKLGPKLDNYYEVLDGVRAGERVVTSATFLIDSESKLAAAGMKGAMGLVGMADVQMRQAKMGGMEGMDVKPTSVRQEKKVGEITIEISSKPDPPKAGEALFIVRLTDKEGNIIRDAKVGLIFKMAMPGMAPVKTAGQLSKEGLYEAKAGLPMSGEWDLLVSILMPGKPEIKEMFKIMVGM